MYDVGIMRMNGPICFLFFFFLGKNRRAQVKALVRDGEVEFFLVVVVVIMRCRLCCGMSS